MRLVPKCLREARFWSIMPPFLWLILTLFIPFIIVLKISFAEYDDFLTPPYTNLFEMKDHILSIHLHLQGYINVFTSYLFEYAYINSLKMAFITTVFCILIGYPIAYQIARTDEKYRSYLLMAIIVPFWTSMLLRVYAWVGILRDTGFLNQFLMYIGLINEPLHIYRTNWAVYIGLVYTYLPFFILPLYSTLVKLDYRLLDAAYDLGARPWGAFKRIILPLSMPGVISGAMLVFIPVVGEYVIPELLGGANTYVIGRVMWDQFFSARDWPTASAVTAIMIIVLILPLVIYQSYQAKVSKRGVR